MCPISPDGIGRQVVRNGLTESKNRKFERQIIKELKTLLRLCNTDNPDLHKQFTIEEVKVGLNQLKLGKSPGPDGIHNEFLGNLGENVQHGYHCLSTRVSTTVVFQRCGAEHML